MIISLCLALIRPHLEYCTKFRVLQYKKDVDNVEQVQQGATEMLGKEMLRSQACSPWRREGSGEPTTSLPVPTGRLAGREGCTQMVVWEMRDSRHKWKQSRHWMTGQTFSSGNTVVCSLSWHG